MNTLECVSETDLRAHIFGELPERIDRLVEQHLSVCTRCEEVARSLDRTIDPMIGILRKTMGRTASTMDGQATPGPPPAAIEIECDSLNGFSIKGELGRGGMGVVYLARQRHPDRLVALKVLLAGAHAGAAAKARLLAEANAIAKLHHPKIVQVYEVGEHDGLPYLALEYVKGGSLAALLRGEPMSPQVAARMVAELARAVHFAHQNGVIHRDLKPTNILVGNPQWAVTNKQLRTTPALYAAHCPLQTKITDFGLAKHDGPELTATGELLGTPSYMAPEYAQNGTVGPGIDIWALGAILYECLTGRPPFRGATPLETMEQVRSQAVVPPEQLRPGLSRDLSTVCLKCLERDPHRRYANAAELADDLDRVLADRPPLAHRPGKLEHTWRWCRRNPLSAALAAALMILLPAALVVVSLLYWQSVAARNQARLDAERAVQKSDLARNTVDELIAALGGRLMATQDIPGVRREMYQKALALYDRFATEPGGDALPVQIGHATVLTRLSQVECDLDQLDKSLASHDRAVAILESIAKEHPDNGELLREQRTAALTLGNIHNKAGRNGEAAKAYSLAADYARRHLTLEPDNLNACHSLPIILSNLATSLEKLNRADEAIDVIKEAVVTGRKAATTGDNNCRYSLAVSLTNLGHHLMRSNSYEDAEAAQKEATEVFDKLIASDSQQPTWRERQGDNLTNMGRLVMQRGRSDEAIKILRQALSTRDKLVADIAAMPRYRFKYVITVLNLNQALANEGQWEEAARILNQSLPQCEKLVQDSPQVPDYRALLANLLSELGHCARLTEHDQEALAYFDRAIAERRAEPKILRIPEQRGHHGRTLCYQGTVLARLGQPEKAQAAWTEADQFVRGAEKTLVKVERAKGAARSGDLTSAENAAQELLAEYPTPPPGVARQIASLYAVMAASTKDEAKSQDYIKQCLHFIQSSIAAGTSRSSFLYDREFANVRERIE